MATDLGKVGIVAKGAWSSLATYEVLDAVSYNGETYIAKQDVPAGKLPTNTTYWQTALSVNVEVGTLESTSNVYAYQLKKANRVVDLYLEVYPFSDITSGDVIGVIPEGFRPSFRRGFTGTVSNTSKTQVNGHCQVDISTDGNISITKMPDLGTSNGFLSTSISWVL